MIEILRWSAIVLIVALVGATTAVRTANRWPTLRVPVSILAATAVAWITMPTGAGGLGWSSSIRSRLTTVDWQSMPGDTRLLQGHVDTMGAMIATLVLALGAGAAVLVIGLRRRRSRSRTGAAGGRLVQAMPRAG